MENELNQAFLWSDEDTLSDGECRGTSGFNEVYSSTGLSSLVGEMSLPENSLNQNIESVNNSNDLDDSSTSYMTAFWSLSSTRRTIGSSDPDVYQDVSLNNSSSPIRVSPLVAKDSENHIGNLSHLPLVDLTNSDSDDEAQLLDCKFRSSNSLDLNKNDIATSKGHHDTEEPLTLRSLHKKLLKRKATEGSNSIVLDSTKDKMQRTMPNIGNKKINLFFAAEESNSLNFSAIMHKKSPANTFLEDTMMEKRIQRCLAAISKQIKIIEESTRQMDAWEEGADEPIEYFVGLPPSRQVYEPVERVHYEKENIYPKIIVQTTVTFDTEPEVDTPKTPGLPERQVTRPKESPRVIVSPIKSVEELRKMFSPGIARKSKVRGPRIIVTPSTAKTRARF